MAFPSINQNRTLGKGRVYFSGFVGATQNPAGYRYIGNTPELNLTIETEDLEHFNSDEGIREKDDSVPLQVDRTGNFTTDSIQPENIAQFFFGSREALVVAGGAIVEEERVAKLGHAIQLGESDDNLVGNRNVSNVVIDGDASVKASKAGTFSGVGSENDTITVGVRVYTLTAALAAEDDVLIGASAAATAYNFAQAINGGAGAGTLYHAATVAHALVDAVDPAGSAVVTIRAKAGGVAGNAIALDEAGTGFSWAGAAVFLSGGSAAVVGIAAADNWELDAETGLVTILFGAVDIIEGQALLISYDFAAGTRERILSGSTPVEGAMRFISRNPKGHKFHYTFPWVKLTPNGDYALKGEEWQTIPFNLEVLKRDGDIGAIYVDGDVFTR